MIVGRLTFSEHPATKSADMTADEFRDVRLASLEQRIAILERRNADLERRLNGGAHAPIKFHSLGRRV